MRKVRRRSKKKSLGIFAPIIIPINITKSICATPFGFFSLLVCCFSIWFYASGNYNKSIKIADKAITKFYKKTNLTLKDVYLEGQYYSQDKHIIEAINTDMGQSMPKINIHLIRQNLEELPWIKYAVVERLYPSTLSIRMLERKPIAIWQNNSQLKIIDTQGVVIDEDNIENFSDLIILVGDDAPSNIDSLLMLLEKDADIASMVSSAIRIGLRRWDIRLHNGTQIKLPEENTKHAWSKLISEQKEHSILNSGGQTIDLRIPNKIYINQGHSS